MDPTVLKLRQIHPRFYYHGYHWRIFKNTLEFEFDFEIEPQIKFSPKTTIFNLDPTKIKQVDRDVLDNLVFHVGLIELISYWKATCSPEIVIEAGVLEKGQLSWWKTLLINGLGQFFFTNKIDFQSPDFVTYRVDAKKKHQQSVFNGELNDRRILFPLSGGKDSVVSIELLKHSMREIVPWCLNPTPAVYEILKLNLHLKPIVVKRTIDPKLFDLNAQGYLNGHTPFTAYVSFASLLTSILVDAKTIAVSCERSSDEGNVRFHGMEVNHQYSKSFAFEKSFRQYVNNYLIKKSVYFSLLRPLYEIQIAKIFSHYPAYFSVFKSCNVGQKTNAWCHRCPKCLFTYLILYPFVDENVLTHRIFSKNLWDEKSLIPLALELLGLGKIKPFECVGTREEVQAAFYLSLTKAKKLKTRLPVVLQAVADSADRLPFFSQISAQKILQAFNKDNFLPDALSMIVGLASKSVAIVGFGREGISTLRFLRRMFPGKELSLCDQVPLEKLPEETLKEIRLVKNVNLQLGGNYLSRLDQYSVIFKTSGIPKGMLINTKPDVTITSNTDLFFSLCPGTIIGISGTKGKSTTASVIYEVLKKGGLDVRLVGNIGKPALDSLDSANDKTIFTAELSSYQLADLNKSPHIAVLQDIVPEHLDYHGDFETYQKAKQAITMHQTKDDVLIYNANSYSVAPIVQNSIAQKIPFGFDKYQESGSFIENGYLMFCHAGYCEKIIDVKKIPLRGMFNLQNVMPAIIIGKLYGLTNHTITDAITYFRPLTHRLEFIGDINGISFYNDSISTIPESAIAAINSFPDKKIVLLLGGFDRKLDYTKLAQKIVTSNIRGMILFPTTGERIWESVVKNAASEAQLSRHVFVKTMKEAVQKSYKMAQKGDVVLLSPASASYNMYKNFEERGEQFRKEVLNIREISR